MLERYMLRFLCRYCSKLPGIWRLGLHERAQRFRFSQETLLCRPRPGLSVEVHANDSVGNWLYFFGHYQKNLVDCLLKLARPGDVVLDAGANVGVISLFLAQKVGLSGRVFAVEPARKNSELLARNIDRNGYADVISAECCALGDYCGEGQLIHNPEGEDFGSPSLLRSHGRDTEEVAVNSIDSLWKRWGSPRIRIVKMDIEGAELPALRGAKEMFEAAPPDVCILEFNQAWMKEVESRNPEERPADSIWEFFTSRGYRGYDVGLRALEHPPREDMDVVFRMN